METSAKTKINNEEAFFEVVREIRKMEAKEEEMALRLREKERQLARMHREQERTISAS